MRECEAGVRECEVCRRPVSARARTCSPACRTILWRRRRLWRRVKELPPDHGWRRLHEDLAAASGPQEPRGFTREDLDPQARRLFDEIGVVDSDADGEDAGAAGAGD